MMVLGRTSPRYHFSEGVGEQQLVNILLNRGGHLVMVLRFLRTFN